MKSKLIAISAISAGFIAIFLTVGSYFELIDLFTVVVTSVFVVLPFYYKSYKGCIMAYLAGGLIAFMLSGFNIYTVVFPAYFGFFGIYPIIRNYMQEKQTKKIFVYLIGLIWCVGAVFGVYYLYLAFVPEAMLGMPEWVVNNIFPIIVGLGVVIYFLFDISIIKIQKVIAYYLAKILK